MSSQPYCTEVRLKTANKFRVCIPFVCKLLLSINYGVIINCIFGRLNHFE